ncbi:hypothetical protein HanXRQr2_Chr04g0170411 [Helianthus annuus]|uniref:Uncharacterized protein n=1 Tax=Helianthus annuus TaxID=4232 RepID=A0A9K3NSN7_HELAN|nr:hypothetical protein HanXRQr2_Chr04g0170411 [Helianthus annuus]KAJ0589253.1 hypothetical protein HanIR_Chr04g0184011 [Helianthus annuus]KAJ0931623.1 hypothetical protein HanPSC8_Chr04g0163951 [Helianthus annuus]
MFLFLISWRSNIQNIMARTMGQGSSQASGRGSAQVGGRGVWRGGGGGSSQSSHLVGDRGVGRGGGQTGDRGVGGGSSQSSRLAGDRGVGGGSSQSSCLAGDRVVGRGGNQVGDDASIVHSPIEGSDDDESTFRVGPARRGCASQVQVPEPINREWIYIKDGEFSNQGTSTRIIGSILRALWSGPWDSWRDVPNEHKRRLFERFQY